MTLQFGGASWALDSFQLGVNEISSALLIGNQAGTYFNRRQYSDLIDKICKGLNLHVRKPPKWLQNVEFTRQSTIHGAKMRTILVPDSMSDLKIEQLSGMATFVVLCCRYTENKEETMELINDLLCGRLGGLVETNNQSSDMPYTLKPQLIKFVEACLQADIDSTFSIDARRWMVKLTMYGKLGWHGDELDIGRLEATKEVMSDMFGGRTLEEQMQETNISSLNRDEGSLGWARVYNTLRLSSAYVGLAAAAQRADVVVECITSSGSEYFPKKPKAEMQRHTFLIRLWLVKPPEDVYGILRFSRLKILDKEVAHNDGPEDLVVFGGSREILVAIAKALKFHPASASVDADTVLTSLWEAGKDLGKDLQLINPPNQPGLQSYLFVTGHNDKISIRGCASPLVKALRSLDKRLEGVSRPVAKIVDDVYFFENYGPLVDHNDKELVRAMEFVVVAMAVELLRNISFATDNSLDQYALTPSSLADNDDGALRFLLHRGLHGGLQWIDLIWAASLLWGGASPRSQGYASKPEPHSVGILAPNCTILCDFIRDPVYFAQNDLQGKLLSLWRGATPMLPRDTRTNFIRGLIHGHSLEFQMGKESELSLSTELHETQARDGHASSETMFMTFEPYISDPTVGIFCCWYNGQLVAELYPANILTNLLNKWQGTRAPTNMKNRIRRAPPDGPPAQLRRLRQHDLLQLKYFLPVGGISAYIDGVSDVMWELFAAGCCPRGITVYHHPHPDTPDTPLSVDEIRQAIEEESKNENLAGLIHIIVHPQKDE